MLKNKEVAAWLKPQTLNQNTNSVAIEVCRTRLLETLSRLHRLVPPETLKRIVRLEDNLKNFAVHISLIGQVKAGKTALTNAMIGSPDLLPSDVNPWTSVITSVHVNTPHPLGKNAVFTFFTTDEWDEMLEAGGHLGKMAERANYKEELEELRSQVADMQRRTRARLGRNFNMLLDGYHSFLGFSPKLIKKYVCLGEEDEKNDGRYADITKSAKIYINHSDFVLPTIISDTPGVNDPFLLREAVTLENLSNTDICVVVLSAHQAFSTVDVGLLRILMALKHQQLVLFVNRIDELQDPITQVPEIDRYIRQLLEEQNLPKDLPIVFGSAAWAEVASTGRTNLVSDDSYHMLEDFARAREYQQSDHADRSLPKFGSTENSTTKIQDLSGLYELQNILQENGATKIALPNIKRVREQTLDLTHQALLYLKEANASKSSLRTDLDFASFFDELDTILKDADESCTLIAQELSEQVMLLMSAAFRDFLQNGKVGLKSHVASKKPMNEWRCDSEKLRRDLNLAHDSFVTSAPARVNKVFLATAMRVEKIYDMILDDNEKLFSVRPPISQNPTTPLSLMRTMAIDMGTGWFSNWFRVNFNQASYIKKFEEITTAEMHVTMNEMQAVYVTDFVKRVRIQLHEFLAEHIRTLESLSMLGGVNQRAEVLQKLGVDTEIRHRIAELESIVSELENLFEKPESQGSRRIGSAA